MHSYKQTKIKNLCNSSQGYSAHSHTREFLGAWIWWSYESQSFRNNQETLKTWYKQINKSFPCNCTVTETELLPQHTPQGCQHWDPNMKIWCQQYQCSSHTWRLPFWSYLSSRMRPTYWISCTEPTSHGSEASWAATAPVGTTSQRQTGSDVPAGEHFSFSMRQAVLTVPEVCSWKPHAGSKWCCSREMMATKSSSLEAGGTGTALLWHTSCSLQKNEL